MSNLWVRLEWWCWTLSQFHQPTNPLWPREVPISEMPSLMNIWWLPFANVKKMWCLTHLLDDQDNQIIKCHRSFAKIANSRSKTEWCRRKKNGKSFFHLSPSSDLCHLSPINNTQNVTLWGNGERCIIINVSWWNVMIWKFSITFNQMYDKRNADIFIGSIDTSWRKTYLH